MSFVSTLWAKIKTAVEGDAVKVEDVLTSLEAKFIPALDALLKQLLATIGQQGLVILEQGIQDIITVVESGGNVGAAIAALVPQVTAQVKDDLKQDATNAAHGAIALLLAPASTLASAPATDESDLANEAGAALVEGSASTTTTETEKTSDTVEGAAGATA